jgi:DNA invertase Pin-like site-specific DNA recombinase
MVDLVYMRVSTDEQSTQRQTYLLAEVGLADAAEGVRLFSDPASSKIPALEPAGFRELTRYARPGDRLTVSELYRLCRDLVDILALRVWCQQHQVKLRVLRRPVEHHRPGRHRRDYHHAGQRQRVRQPPPPAGDGMTTNPGDVEPTYLRVSIAGQP